MYLAAEKNYVKPQLDKSLAFEIKVAAIRL